jgi:hypothetical protein
MPYRKMHHDIEPRKAILDELGDISSMELFNNQVLLATYIRPRRTASGIIYTEKTVDEDRYQSKVGLLVKIGPSAFQANDEGWFAGETFEIHDWLVFRPSDGWAINVHGVECRILVDTQIKGRVKEPDEVW